MVLNDGQNVYHHGEQQNPVEQLFVKDYPDTHERAIPRLQSGVDRDDLGRLDDTEQPDLAPSSLRDEKAAQGNQNEKQI